MQLLETVTSFGDAAAILPAALVLAVIVWRFQSRAAAFWLLGSLMGCGAVVAVLKLVFGACAAAWGTSIVSPSGHASMSLAFYGALAVIARRQVSRAHAALLLGAIALLIAAVAVSRVAIGVHSPSEVAVGLSVGAVALAVFALRYARVPPRAMSYVLLLGLPTLTVLAMTGQHLDLESSMRRASSSLGGRYCGGGPEHLGVPASPIGTGQPANSGSGNP
jgi:membrane-associated phospholipid phosphatase